VVEPGPGSGEEERLGGRAWTQFVASALVVGESLDGGGVQWDQPGLAELGPPHQQDTAVQVRVAPVQSHRLSGADPGRGHEPDEGLERRRAKGVGQVPGRVDQRGDLRLRIQIRRRRPPGAAGQQARRRDLSKLIESRQEAGELADHRQSGRPPGRIGVARQHGPLQCGLDRQVRVPALLQEADELAEHPALDLEFVAQAPADRQIAIGTVPDAFHRSLAAGQGRMTGASAAMSTFA
jgi:hypothetical protein